ncbi:MAG: YbaK/EbsC family protein [Rhodovibrionaceae bacterium]|nr:YbaK/EbsC family protein [Rhodovibrionaceae bacterium]
MTVSKKLTDYLDNAAATYTVRSHPRSATSAEAAHAAHVPESDFAKAVVLKDAEGYFVAVLPASREIVLAQLWRTLHSPVELASEAEIANLFDDCAMGAVPAFGQAYDLPVVVDEHLMSRPTVYIEGGDHESVVEMPGEAFAQLMRDARHANFVAHRPEPLAS